MYCHATCFAPIIRLALYLESLLFPCVVPASSNRLWVVRVISSCFGSVRQLAYWYDSAYDCAGNRQKLFQVTLHGYASSAAADIHFLFTPHPLDPARIKAQKGQGYIYPKSFATAIFSSLASNVISRYAVSLRSTSAQDATHAID